VPLRSLDDLKVFATVVAQNSFSGAARALHVPKSTISKRIARLEEDLGVRLLERSTRRLRVTDVGQAFYEKCQAVISGAEAAEAVIEDARSDPKGIVRIAAPPSIARTLLGPVLQSFVKRYPLVKLQIHVLSRRVDLIEERIDVAFRVRTVLDGDPTLTVRVLGQSHSVVVASPDFVAAHPPITTDMLHDLPKLSAGAQLLRETWRLVDERGSIADIVVEPHIACGDFSVVRDAAIAGLGVALLPRHICGAAIARGALVDVLSGWATPPSTVHLVCTARHGMLPAVRAFIDHVAEHIPPLIAPADLEEMSDIRSKVQRNRAAEGR
jgi:DNA-binding transcriptional LysR family regulator